MTTREVEHEITIEAPAEVVYRLIADVDNWPQIFPPTIHVEPIERDGDAERIRVWATANGLVKNWTSRRVLDPENLRITFRQEVSTPPVASMGGAWVIEAISADTSRVRLLHDYRAVDDDADALKWIGQAVDHNSSSELQALKTNTELAHASEVAFSFEDVLHIEGSAKEAYDFINEADLWAQRLPHVATVHLTEDVPGLQTLEMDTVAADGSVHTTKSYRVTFPQHRIVYKQVILPALMALHTGRWTFEESTDGVIATSRHTVVLNTENVPRILGADATVATACDYVRNALSTNSRAMPGS